MARPSHWSEAEVRAAVAAYFRLIGADESGAKTNKQSVYQGLAQRFPARSAKAFELKFQNISAILYELRLPYCSGLKPRFNYQRLLRLFVLDHLDRSPLPAIEPHRVLFKKLRELADRGLIPIKKQGSGRYGLAIEEALGIPQNSDKSADFMGIELKTKSDGTLQTLFSRVPSRFVQDVDCKEMFSRHSYDDSKRNRRGLYTSFGSAPDSLGFKLVATSRVVRIVRRARTLFEYDAEALEAALLSKHTHTAYIGLERCTSKGKEACKLLTVRYCKWPSILRFLQLIRGGKVYLDLMMSSDGKGGVKNHGFLWRIEAASVERLYLSTESVNFTGQPLVRNQ